MVYGALKSVFEVKSIFGNTLNFDIVEKAASFIYTAKESSSTTTSKLLKICHNNFFKYISAPYILCADFLTFSDLLHL